MVLTLPLLSTVTRFIAGLFAFSGVVACFVLVVRAMRECNSDSFHGHLTDESRKAQKEGRRKDNLEVPRYIPRLFLTSYVSIIVSYIIQIIDLSLRTTPHQDPQYWELNTTALAIDNSLNNMDIHNLGQIDYLDLFLNCFTTILLIGLPIYHGSTRRMIRFSLSNDLHGRGRDSKRENGNDRSFAGDENFVSRTEGDVEGGFVEEELRRDLRVIMDRNRRRKTV